MARHQLGLRRNKREKKEKGQHGNLSQEKVAMIGPQLEILHQNGVGQETGRPERLNHVKVTTVGHQLGLTLLDRVGLEKENQGNPYLGKVMVTKTVVVEHGAKDVLMCDAEANRVRHQQ